MNIQLAPQLLAKLLKSWNGEWVANLKGSNAQFIEFKSLGQHYILRLTEAERRSRKEILGEINWILYLKKTGLNVCYPITDKTGTLLHKFNIESNPYWAVAFTKAIGKQEIFNVYKDGFVKNWGRTLAKMHDAAINYTPLLARSEWNIEVLIQHAKKTLGKGDDKVLDQMKIAARHLAQLTPTTTTYGLIHSDLTPGNFFVTEEGDICIYDFDDSQYSYFIYDFVVILFMTMFHKTNQKTNFSIPDFYAEFLSGYHEIRTFSTASIEALPHFLNFFNSLVYVSLVERNIRESNQALCDFVVANLEQKFYF